MIFKKFIFGTGHAMNIFAYIETALTQSGDEKFALLTQKTIPNLSREYIYGVRTPDLRKLAKELRKPVIPAEFSVSSAAQIL